MVCLAALKKMGISPKHLTFLKKTVDKEYLLSHNAVLPLRVRKDEGLLEHSFCELLNNMQVIQAILVSQVKKDFYKVLNLRLIQKIWPVLKLKFLQDLL